MNGSKSLEERIQIAHLGGGQNRIDDQHKKGKLKFAEPILLFLSL